MAMKPPSCLKRQLDIKLNVYDLVEANKFGAGVGIGAFHSGCELDGVEYSFGLNDYNPPRTGVWRCKPMCAPGFTHRTTVHIGTISISMDEVEAVIEQMRGEWMGNDYDLVNRNCNHFTDALCQRLCDRKIPRWINRLARWGASLSNVFGRPEALGPERWTPDSVKAPEAQDEPSLREEKPALTEAEERVLADVMGGMTEVLTTGISKGAILARMVEAMCWSFSATEFTAFLTAHTFVTYTLPEQTFTQLCYLANHAVVSYAATGDHTSLRHLLAIAVRLHSLNEQQQPQMMINTLSKHAFWHDSGLWTGIFYEGFTEMVLRSQLENPGDQTDEIRQYAFAELTVLTHAMSSLGLPAPEVARFLYTMRGANMLDQEQYEMLAQLAQRTEGGNSAGQSPLEGFISPRAKPKYTQSSMNAMLTCLLGQRQPETMEDLMQWLDLCSDISSVRGFVRQLGRILDGCQQHHLEPGPFYILSAMLTRSLTTCDAMRDYATTRAIMHASLLIHGPTLGAKSMTQELSLGASTSPKAREELGESIVRSPEGAWGENAVEHAMSRTTCRHGIWQSIAYWVNVITFSCNQESSLLKRDEDPSVSQFVCLNKVVQLMFTFHVSKAVISDVIREILERFDWSPDYRPLCEHLLGSIKTMQ